MTVGHGTHLEHPKSSGHGHRQNSGLMLGEVDGPHQKHHNKFVWAELKILIDLDPRQKGACAECHQRADSVEEKTQ